MTDTSNHDWLREVSLIQCTDSKRDTTAPARDLYDESGYFRAMRSWADAAGRPWFILSAKHGLVRPDAKLEPYDAFGLSADQAAEIARFFGNHETHTVYVCAGRSYTDPLIPELEQRGIDVIDPFAGLEIGKRISKLQDKTAALKHDQLC